MDLDLKVSSERTRSMESGVFSLKMGKNTQVISSMEKCMERGNVTGQMGDATLGNILKI